ncbi:hypothetical protein L085_12710 [Serratia sp. FS14]|nr:hypothetical protein L085_12710 [Serratia sp. FS14]
MHRAAFKQRRRQQTIDFSFGIVGSETGLRHGHFLRHADKMPEVAIPQRMMKQAASLLNAQSRRTDHMDHRHIFGIAAGNAVDSAELTHAEGCQQCSRRLAARVTIGSISRIQLVGAAYPRDLSMSAHMIEKLQIVITRYSKYMADADLGQAIEKVISYGIIFSHGKNLLKSEKR